MATNSESSNTIENQRKRNTASRSRSGSRATPGSRRRDESSTDGPERVAVVPFELQGTRYCVESARIVSVLGVSFDGSLRAVSDPWNAGEVTVEDGRIRIVDLARVFSSPTAPIERGEDPRLLVFETRGDSDAADYCAWLVDDVDVVMSVDPGRLVRTMSRAGTQFVTGQIELDGETVVWLDEEAVNDQ